VQRIAGQNVAPVGRTARLKKRTGYATLKPEAVGDSMGGASTLSDAIQMDIFLTKVLIVLIVAMIVGGTTYVTLTIIEILQKK
jgi:hypothetical protein